MRKGRSFYFCGFAYFRHYFEGGRKMYVTLDFSRLPKKERKYMKKRKVEEKLNEAIESGAKYGFLELKTMRLIVPYQIGRDIQESANGQLSFEFYGWKKWKIKYGKKVHYGKKAVYKWCLPGYEMPAEK